MELGVRLDFFGDALESIRSFDPQTQRSSGQLRALELVPMSEFQLTPETIRRFRQGYAKEFGAAAPDDILYEAVSEGRRYPGMEHWLPLFQEKLDTLFDYAPGSPVVLDPLVEDAAKERLAQIADYYQARRDALDAKAVGAPYKPLPPDRLYFGESEWTERLGSVPLARMTPFSVPERGDGAIIEIGARQGRNFAAERAEPHGNLYDAVASHVGALQANGKRVLIALWSEGARERMRHVLADHGLVNLVEVANFSDALRRPKPEVGLAVLGLEAGFETAELAVVGEQDILGDRLARRQARRRFHRRGDQSQRRRPRRPHRPRHRPLRRPDQYRSRRCPARLPGNPLRWRRQAVPAGREHRTALPLWLRGGGRRARPARRRRLAGPQGAAQAAHPRDGGRAGQGRGRAAAARGAAAHRRARALRRVLRRFPL